ncbi:MAG: L,D-transpeptidase [Actinomycetia bacterium]|nr:L,D-transpeptidase [Actinomycetes bacterium]
MVAGLLAVDCASESGDSQSAVTPASSSAPGASTSVRGADKRSGVADLVGEVEPADSLTAVVFTTKIAIGTGETPTPIGSLFTTVLYEVPDPSGPYGPYAFALSGFSEVLSSFGGGDGLIGIHGTNDPSSLGTEVSHGCIRIPNDLITQMAEMVPLGTPVRIVA